MKARLYLILLLSLAGACTAQVTNIPIIDGASIHSPLGNEGSVTFQRTVDGASAELTYSDNWIVRNISSKPIIAVHEVLIVHYADGGSRVHRADSDMFFGAKRLEPDAALDFSAPPSTVEHHATQSDSQPRIVSCEATEQWVQFEDGTTFGDPSYGQDTLSSRRADLQELARLNQVYASEGPEGFLRQLQQPSTRINYRIENLRGIQRMEGTEKAVQYLQTELAVAESRKGLL